MWIGDADFGYIEIAARDGKTVEAKTGVFCGEDRLSLDTCDTAGPDDWFVLGGYPEALEQITEHCLGSAIYAVTTKLSSARKAPKNFLNRPPQGLQTLNLWLREDGVNTSTLKRIKLLQTRGMSGGGCWKANLYPNPKGWNSSRFQLSGVYMGSWKEDIQGQCQCFLRAISVAHHLRMIADDCSDLRDRIYEKWPVLKSVPQHKSFRLM